MTSYCRSRFTLSAHQKPTVGDQKFSVIDHDHMGWLKCEGRYLSPSTHYFLFQVIGYSFGESNGLFALPNPSGRVPGVIGNGQDSVQSTFSVTLGQSIGEYQHTLTVPELATHNHGMDSNNMYTASNSDHHHTGTTDADGLHSHTTNANGGAGVGSLGLVVVTGQNTANGSLNPSLGEPDLYANPVALTVNNNGSHTHTFVTSEAGAHAHEIRPEGSNLPHNNMQPTLFMGNMFIYSGLSQQEFYPYTLGKNIY